MKPVLKLKSGRVLEQICRQYAWGLGSVDLIHLFTIDKSMRLEFRKGEWEELNRSLLPLPGFPVDLDKYQQRYNDVKPYYFPPVLQFLISLQIKTCTDCLNMDIKRARSTDERWIDDAMYHWFVSPQHMIAFSIVALTFRMIAFDCFLSSTLPIPVVLKDGGTLSSIPFFGIST